MILMIKGADEAPKRPCHGGQYWDEGSDPDELTDNYYGYGFELASEPRVLEVEGIQLFVNLH